MIDRPSEKKDYRFKRLVSHLSDLQNYQGIFDLIDQGPFLARQADYLGGFEQSGEDVEEHAIPAALHEHDWHRFLHYAALALNFRGLAEALAEPEILEALVKAGRAALARGLVARIADPLRRVEARAALAASCERGSELFEDLLRNLGEDLAAVRPTAPVLCAVARRLGPDLSSHWQIWIDQLEDSAQQAPAVWKAVAESWLDRGEIAAPELWAALSEVKIPQLLLDLALRLGEQETANVDELLQRLDSLFPTDDEARRRARARYLGRLVRCRSDLALPAWERWVEADVLPWTPALVEDGREIFKMLDLSRIEEFIARQDDREAQAAVRIAILEARPDAVRKEAALEAVSAIPDGPAKLHWSLRYLEARPAEPLEEIRGQVAAVAAYLHEIRHDAPPEDIRRYLDLVARFYPNELKHQVEDVAWSPANRPETLLTVARKTECPEIAERLLENAERFASAVSLTEAEGFRLRGELIQAAVSRLCTLRKALAALNVAAERLLPEEEDDLRTALAPALAAAGRRQEALQVAEGIRDLRRQLLARLRALPPGEVPADLLSAHSLYKAMASAGRLEEELSALSALLVLPFDPQDLARQRIAPIRDQEIQIQALLRLARHSLAFQKTAYGRRQDRVAALEIVRSSLAVETDERLVALTPDIATLGAEIGGSAAVAELQEAARRIATLETVSWEARAAALEHLLSQIEPVFLKEDCGRRSVRRATAVLDFMARLPAGPPTDQTLDDLRSHWHQFLPILLSAFERLPGRPKLKDFGDHLASGRDPSSSAILSLCAADPDERLRRADRMLAEASPDPGSLCALAYLLAPHAPDQVPALVKRLPPELRDDLSLRLIRHRWIAGRPAESLLNGMAESWHRTEAEVWLFLSDSEEAGTQRWLDSLASLAAQRGVPPSEPGLGEILSHLWLCAFEASRPALGAIFTSALRGGGRERGEAALRLWLHAHLAPRPGTEQPENLSRSKDAKAALERSLELSPVSQS